MSKQWAARHKIGVANSQVALGFIRTNGMFGYPIPEVRGSTVSAGLLTSKIIPVPVFVSLSHRCDTHEPPIEPTKLESDAVEQQVEESAAAAEAIAAAGEDEEDKVLPHEE